MDVKKTIRERRSIRKFKKRKVSRELIEKIVEAGRYAPSACNLQMWKFIVVDDQKIKEKISSVSNSPSPIKDSAFVVFVVYDEKATPKHYANIQSAAAAIQNMLLMAHSLGIGSVWMSEDGDRCKIRDILRIPEKFFQVATVAFGYPDETPKCPARREGTISYGSFDNNPLHDYPSSLNPDDWTMEQIKNYHSFKIRAKSPSSEIHNPKSPTIRLTADEIGKIEGKVLDVFPYYANYTHMLLRDGKISNLTVLEMSDEVNDFIKWKMKPLDKNVKTIKGTDKFPVKDENFDCVTCFGSLDLVPNPEDVIKEMHRVLKKSGTLYLVFSNKGSPFGLYFSYRMMMGRSLDVPFRPFSYGGMMDKLKGFKIERIVGINLVPRTSMENFKTTSPLKRFCKTILVKARKV